MSDFAQLLVDQLDIWSKAIERKNGAGRSTGGKISLYGIEKLRSLILDLAVRGKLVPQDPNDEPALGLLKRHKLSNQGKIRSSRGEETNRSNPQTYTLPATWIWAQFDEVVTFNAGRTPSTKDSSFWEEADAGHAWVSIADLNHNGSVRSTERFVSEKAANNVFRGSPKPTGTILMSFKLTVGKTSRLEIPAYHNEAIISVHSAGALDDNFLFTILPIIAAGGKTKDAIKGKTLNNKSLAALWVPLPPLAEQKRIVDKVDELMSLCDALEKETREAMMSHETLVRELLATLVNSQDADDLVENWFRIQAHFDTLFTTEDSIGSLKQTILDMAVRGELVPPCEIATPSADQQLKLISRQRDRLVESGEIRRERSKPYSNDKPPFSLPSCWIWARIGELALFTQYGTSQKAIEGIDGPPVLAMGNINDGEVDTQAIKCIPYDSPELPDLYLKQRDLLYNRTNSYELVGKTGIFVGADDQFTFASYLIRIRLLSEATVPEFINMAMNSTYFRRTQVEPKITKQTGQANVNGTSMRSMFVPVPPIAEQKRIVEAVEELFILLERLSDAISISDRLEARMADQVTCTG